MAMRAFFSPPRISKSNSARLQQLLAHCDESGRASRKRQPDGQAQHAGDLCCFRDTATGRSRCFCRCRPAAADSAKHGETDGASRHSGRGRSGHVEGLRSCWARSDARARSVSWESDWLSREACAKAKSSILPSQPSACTTPSRTQRPTATQRSAAYLSPRREVIFAASTVVALSSLLPTATRLTMVTQEVAVKAREVNIPTENHFCIPSFSTTTWTASRAFSTPSAWWDEKLEADFHIISRRAHAHAEYFALHPREWRRDR